MDPQEPTAVEQYSLLDGVPSDVARKRKRRRGSIEVLPSGTHRARIRGRSARGRKYDLSCDVPTRAEAERALEALRREAWDLESGAKLVEETITLAALCERARRARTGQGGKSFQWTGKDDSGWKLLRPLWQLRLQDLDAARVRGWAESLRARGYAPSTVRSIAILLRRLMGWALDAQILAHLPWGDRTRLVLVSDRECGRSRDLEPAELRALFEAAARYDRARGGAADLTVRLLMSYTTAARPIELAPLPLASIVQGMVVAGAKGSNDRDVPVSARLAELVHRMASLRAGDGSGLAFPVQGRRGWEPRWRTHRGVRQAYRWLTPAELRALRAAVPDFHVYQLRHARLTEVHQRSPALAKALGGHRTERMVGRYDHTGRRHLEAAAELWDPMALLFPLEDEPTDPPPAPTGAPMAFPPAPVEPPAGPMALAPTAGPPAPTDFPPAEKPRRAPRKHRPPPAGKTPGPAVGPGGRMSADQAAAYAQAWSAEGHELTRRLVRDLGPGDAYRLSASLAGALLRSAAVEALHGEAVRALIEALRSEARFQGTKTGAFAGDFVSDYAGLDSDSDLRFTENMPTRKD